jgi:large subunit ribosomal protein L13
MNLNKAFIPKEKDLSEKWHLIDASGKVIGRLATEVAKMVRGADNPMYTPHVKTGCRVVIINAEKAVFTGKKMKDKVYYKHTRYIGNQKKITAKEMLEKNPEFILKHAIKGMLKKNKLENQLFKSHVKVYAGPINKHLAQIKA